LLAAAMAYEVMWVAGSRSWLVGPPPAGVWGHVGLLSGLAWQPWLVQYLFMRWGCGDDMNCAKFLRGSCLDSLLLGAWGRSWWLFIRPKGVCTVATPVS